MKPYHYPFKPKIFYLYYYMRYYSYLYVISLPQIFILYYFIILEFNHLYWSFSLGLFFQMILDYSSYLVKKKIIILFLSLALQVFYFEIICNLELFRHFINFLLFFELIDHFKKLIYSLGCYYYLEELKNCWKVFVGYFMLLIFQ